MFKINKKGIARADKLATHLESIDKMRKEAAQERKIDVIEGSKPQ